MTPESSTPGVREIFRLFLKIGATAYGGHLSLTSAVQSEAIERRKWVSGDRWSEILAVCATLPGPLAVDAVACLGYAVRGLPGAIAALVGVMLPATLLITVFAAAYGGMNEYAGLHNAFRYFMPAVAGIVLFASFSLGRQTLRVRKDWLIAAGAAIGLALTRGHGLAWLLAIAAMIGFLPAWRDRDPLAKQRWPGHATWALGAAAATAGLALTLPLIPVHSVTWDLLAGFASTSVLMIGGGYAAVPLFEHVTVSQHAWVNIAELTDALALSQLTPGPILVSAGFIGYRAGGYSGEIAAMTGMFLPMILISVMISQTLSHISHIWWVRGILNGVKPAIVGMIAIAGILMVPHFPDLAISGLVFTASLVALIRYRQPTWTVIALAAVVGLVIS